MVCTIVTTNQMKDRSTVTYVLFLLPSRSRFILEPGGLIVKKWIPDISKSRSKVTISKIALGLISRFQKCILDQDQ